VIVGGLQRKRTKPTTSTEPFRKRLVKRLEQASGSTTSEGGREGVRGELKARNHKILILGKNSVTCSASLGEGSKKGRTTHCEK